MIDLALFHNIKFIKEVEGLLKRQIATKLGISRNTVSKYLINNSAPTTVLRKNIYGTKEPRQKLAGFLHYGDYHLTE